MPWLFSYKNKVNAYPLYTSMDHKSSNTNRDRPWEPGLNR